MQLKEIDIVGFKSFPERTVIGFDEGITAIVGPNGSGKSNISDAVRWVLGEQSIKSLRGNSMKDVIFAGTKKRKPLGYAEVTIIFDNKSGKIPIDYKEVAFTRRVFRSGESEYYINKNSCRLMDIRELLMDTGIGKEGYSIIGQGKIDEILSSRSEDRRNIFEEAAGIVKYKNKKEDSEKKLNRTEDNLIRVNDLISELLKQEKTLKKQAKIALDYEKLYLKLKKLDINNYIKKLETLNFRLEKIEYKIKKYKKNLEENKFIHKGYIDEIGKLNFELEEIEERLEGKKDKKFNLIKEKDKEKNKISILEEKERYNKKDIKRLNGENEEFIESIKKLDKENLNLSKEIEVIQENLKNYEYSQSKKLEELKERNESIRFLEKNIDSFKNNLIELYNDVSDNKSKYNNTISFIENVDKRLNQLKYKIEEEEKNKLLILNNIKKIDLERKKLEKELIELNFRKNKYNGIIFEKENEFKRIEDKLNRINIAIETNLSNYKLYKNMEDTYEGYYHGVKSILKASERNEKISKSLIGIVADLIKIKPDHELAISIALGGNLQNIVTPDQQSGKIIIDYLRENKLGRVTCLPKNTIKGRLININSKDRNKYRVIGLGSEIVEFNEKYRNIIENLLGRTVIIKDMDNAIGLSNKYKNSLRIVTLGGDVINPGGSMTGGSQGRNKTNILSRKNKIISIEKQIDNYKKEKDRILEKKNILLDEGKIFREKCIEIEEDIRDREHELIKTTNIFENETEKIKRIEKDIKRFKREIEGLEKEEKVNKKEKDSLKSLIIQLESELESLREKIKVSESRLKEEISTKDKVSELVTENKIFLNKKENRLVNLKEALSKNQETIKKNQRKIEWNKGKEKEIKKELGDIRVGIESSLKNIKLYKEKNIELDFRIDSISRNLKNKKVSLEEITKKDKLVTEEIDELSEKVNKLDLLKTKKELEKESFHSNLYKDYELDYNSALEFKDTNLDLEDSGNRVLELRKEIKKLGSINPNSIEEYESLKDRLDFILEQKDDLDKAKRDLEKVISDMEVKMETLFIESFEEINTNFKIIFKTLFNGGNANLILEDKKNILTTGIDIEAQPPGKKLQSLASLSGGERSLVAVSLLFAILKIKPAPFCILDEIDAALDEANIGRYTSYLKQISQDTQFIIITHRKRTMEMADILYGVTMEEEGVSKILSVELTEHNEIVS